MKQPVCLVTGATGVIGPNLIRALLARDYRVSALVRREIRPDELPAEVEIVTGDLTDARALATAAKDVDVIFHLAAKLHINDPDPVLADEYHRVNVEGTRLLLEAARA
ncbi:MAG: NAD-dependent epimerase/dehydratase family protein, partial [Pyrinomonadaceae bacterium]